MSQSHHRLLKLYLMKFFGIRCFFNLLPTNATYLVDLNKIIQRVENFILLCISANWFLYLDYVRILITACWWVWSVNDPLNFLLLYHTILCTEVKTLSGSRKNHESSRLKQLCQGCLISQLCTVVMIKKIVFW